MAQTCTATKHGKRCQDRVAGHTNAAFSPASDTVVSRNSLPHQAFFFPEISEVILCHSGINPRLLKLSVRNKMERISSGKDIHL